uniref:Alpha 1,4-glycosyltransferase domain-containing protein n=1 Tax=viral metagenome TaxID=1070528 RepID=A0A6C0II82_9ZZZZ
MSAIPKVIYFTYKTIPPVYVFKRWKALNPTYSIDLSLDADCIDFLTQHFTKDIAELFQIIPKGMYKADLWRLCKLYISGGVYADIDLVPYVSVETLIINNYTFYSCLDTGKNGIFQAFMITPPRNPLLLSFIQSFFQKKPWTYFNGPTYDMYNCIKYNLNNINLSADTLYLLDTVRVTIHVGTSITNIKYINLYNFDKSHEYTFVSSHNNYCFEIRENMLIVKQIHQENTNCWTDDISVDIFIKTKQAIYLFKEQFYIGKYIVTFKGKQIFDSRDPNYERESSNFNRREFTRLIMSTKKKFSIRNGLTK